MNSRCFTILISILFAFSFTGNGQQIPDTSFRQKAIANLIQYYHTAIGLQAHLYNGPQYAAYPRPFTEGHQFFETDSFRNGTVFYDGLQYLNVQLKLDIIRDELIMHHPGNSFNVNLIKEKIDSFSIVKHSFKNIREHSGAHLAPAAGFYQQLYFSSSISFLAKRKKYIQEMSETTGISTKVYNKDNHFILKDGVYHTIKNKKSFINVVKDKRGEMQKFIKNNNLKFKKGLEGDVVKALGYYGLL